METLSNDDADVYENENKQTTKKKQWVKIGKTTTLHVNHAFLYISLPSLHK